MSVCSRCQYENADAAPICVRCGRRLELGPPTLAGVPMPDNPAPAAPEPTLEAATPPPETEQATAAPPPETEQATAAAPPAAEPAPPATSALTPVPAMSAQRWSEAGPAPFLMANQWWTKGPAGEVLRWNAASEQWDQLSATETPFFMRRPAFRSPRALAIALAAAFAIFIPSAIAGAVAAFAAYRVGQRALDGEYANLTARTDAVNDAHNAFTVVTGLQSLVQITIVVLFIMWTYRVSKNAPSLGANPPRFGGGWAIGGWFVPILAWWRPFQVLNEAWKVGSPAAPLNDSDGWRSTPVSPLLVTWWVLYNVLSAVWGFGRSFANPKEQSIETWQLVVGIGGVANTLMAAIAVLTVVVVLRLSARQDARDRALDLPAGMAEAPPMAERAAPAPRTTTTTGW